MVTLRKVSLNWLTITLVSRTVEMVAAVESLTLTRNRPSLLVTSTQEAESAAAKNEQRAKEERETLAEMPRVPDALPAPQSLGGLLKHMQDDESMTSLAERTAETNEDIEERQLLPMPSLSWMKRLKKLLNRALSWTMR